MAEEAIYKAGYDNHEAVEGIGWGMGMHLHKAKNMTRNANRHTGLLRA